MMHTSDQRPLPEPTEWSRPFWEATVERRLIFQTCEECGERIMYPKRFCPSCLSKNLSWTEASGGGAVYSFTVQERGAPTGFEDRVPYVLAIVRLEEGVQLMSNIVGPGATEVWCDAPVQVDFEPADDGFVLPVFRLTRAPTRRRNSGFSDRLNTGDLYGHGDDR